ncbi:hypothetical protein KC980_02635 [candidate division WWE3 bacterium]|uniref:Uncharacterized protein n=1 Tax=candidate division WWE3 bacterium TaxID=2053526 RepID=A0A955ECF3_UNCKA|nr:hypothetical protein [candidate division WWE3 bacterium]
MKLHNRQKVNVLMFLFAVIFVFAIGSKYSDSFNFLAFVGVDKVEASHGSPPVPCPDPSICCTKVCGQGYKIGDGDDGNIRVTYLESEICGHYWINFGCAQWQALPDRNGIDDCDKDGEFCERYCWYAPVCSPSDDKPSRKIVASVRDRITGAPVKDVVLAFDSNRQGVAKLTTADNGKTSKMLHTAEQYQLTLDSLPSGYSGPLSTTNDIESEDHCEGRKNTPLGSTLYRCQRAMEDDCGTSPHECSFLVNSFPPFSNLTGSVVDQDTGVGIPNVQVELFMPAGGTVVLTTNAQGIWTYNNVVFQGTIYAVRPVVTSIPDKYTTPFKATNAGSVNHCGNTDFGTDGYECQIAGNQDCGTSAQGCSMTLPKAPSNDALGKFTSATCEWFEGYAFDLDDKYKDVVIELVRDGPLGAGGTSFLTTQTDFFSGSEACRAAGFTNCGICDTGYINDPKCNLGFKSAVPLVGSIFDGKSHSIYAYAHNLPNTSGNSITLLEGSPKTITCSPKNPIGEIKFECTGIEGWAGDADNIRQDTYIEIYEGGKKDAGGKHIWSIQANEFIKPYSYDACVALGGGNLCGVCSSSNGLAPAQCQHAFSTDWLGIIDQGSGNIVNYNDGKERTYWVYAKNLPGSLGFDTPLVSGKTMACGDTDATITGSITVLPDGASCSDITDYTDPSLKLSPSSVFVPAGSSVEDEVQVRVAYTPVNGAGFFDVENWDPATSTYEIKTPFVEPHNRYFSTSSFYGATGANQQTSYSYNLACYQIEDGPSKEAVGPFEFTLKDNIDDINIINIAFSRTNNLVPWYTVSDAGVYSGNTNMSISLFTPLASETSGGFIGRLIDGSGVLLTAGDKNVRDLNGVSTVGGFSAAHKDHYAIRAGDASSPTLYWPESYNFEIPGNAEEITNCNNILAGSPTPLTSSKVYKTSVSCLNSILSLSSSNIYNIAESNSVVTIYVYGSDPVVFQDQFRASGNGSRILFVINTNVIIAPSVGDGAINPSDGAHIQASLIVNGDVDFASSGGTDSSVIIEGPLVTGEPTGESTEHTVLFNRDRGSSNGYPAVYVKYNPIYLRALTRQAESNATLNSSGLFNVDLRWEVLE